MTTAVQARRERRRERDEHRAKVAAADRKYVEHKLNWGSALHEAAHFIACLRSGTPVAELVAENETGYCRPDGEWRGSEMGRAITGMAGALAEAILTDTEDARMSESDIGYIMEGVGAFDSCPMSHVRDAAERLVREYAPMILAVAEELAIRRRLDATALAKLVHNPDSGLSEFASLYQHPADAERELLARGEVYMRTIRAKRRTLAARMKGAPELLLYGDILDEGFRDGDGGVTPRQFIAELKALGNVREFTLRINSEGGSVFAAEAIRSAIRRHGATVLVEIDGVAASSASLVAMAGDHIRIAPGGWMMIHRPYILTGGTARELRAKADTLDGIEANVRRVYAQRSGRSEDAVAALMADESWMDARQSVELGFADSISEGLRVAARGAGLVAHSRHNLAAGFKNIPPTARPLLSITE